MANLLKMAISETIHTLYRRGSSQWRIADQLGINRETVARHLRQADPLPKPANAPTGSLRRRSAKLASAHGSEAHRHRLAPRIETRSATPRPWSGQWL